MPGQTSRSCADATRSLVTEPAGSDTIAARAASLGAFSSAISPPLGFRGVRRYWSIEEATFDHACMVVARPRARSSANRSLYGPQSPATEPQRTL